MVFDGVTTISLSSSNDFVKWVRSFEGSSSVFSGQATFSLAGSSDFFTAGGGDPTDVEVSRTTSEKPACRSTELRSTPSVFEGAGAEGEGISSPSNVPREHPRRDGQQPDIPCSHRGRSPGLLRAPSTKRQRL